MNAPHPFRSAIRRFAALAFALAALAGSAAATTLTVTTTADSGTGSLRAQIDAAASGDTIVFDPALSGQTITLTSAELTIAKNLTIDGGAPASGIQVSGNNARRVFNINPGTTNALSHLSIVNGHVTGNGGGIYNGGTLSLTACTIAQNSAAFGSGISNTGTLTLTACTLSGNAATVFGGGIFNWGASGTVTLTACTLSSNVAGEHGGGISNENGSLLLSSCIVAGNTAPDRANFYILSGNIASQGYNLSNDWGAVATTTGDLSKTAAELKLGALADNSGPTQTRALSYDSAAIDCGDPSLTTATDQRGTPRGSAPDIGAYEYDATAPTLSLVSITSNHATPALARLGDTLTLSFTASEMIRTPTVTIAGQAATVTGSSTSWTATTIVTAGATQGAATLSIAFADFIGNAGTTVTATTDSSSVTIDTVAPAKPVITTSGTTTDATPTIVGTAETGVTVTLYDGLDLLGSTTATGATGAWTFTPGSALSIGEHAILATTTDAAGNESDDFAFILLTIGTPTIPGAPTGVTAVAGNGFAIVSFTAPSDNGGSAITGYTVTVRIGGAVVTTVTGSTSPITVTGLTNDSPAYNFTVAATNSVGTGPASVPSNPVTPSASIHIPFVTTTADSGAGSLRQAIVDALPGKTILFDTALSGQTITLTSGELGIFKNLTIDASALASPIQISGNNTSRVFGIGLGTTVAFSHLGILNGVASGGYGGGILAVGATLTLTNCTISKNSGSGIYTVAPWDESGENLIACKLTLTNCTLSDNSTINQISGTGGIYIDWSCTATLTNCTLTGNRVLSIAGEGLGGGISNNGGMLVLTDCTLSSNETAGPGGGIYNLAGAATLTNCTLSGNSTSVAQGGGIYNNSRGTLTLINCTLAGNSAAEYGGGIFNSNVSTANLTNCTLFDNSANKGGGICNIVSSLTLKSSIVAGNTASTAGANFFNTNATFLITSQGYNLSDDWGTVATTTGDLTKTVADLKLGALNDNGGPTETLALHTGSAAIDAGAPGASPSTDQRGIVRPQGAAADIGAYEYDSTAPTLSPVSLVSNNATPTQARLGDTITLTFTSSEPIPKPDVTLAGQTATVTGSGTSWTATTTVVAGTPEGVATVAVAFADFIGNVGTAVTATTDGTSVTIDTIAPAAPIFTTATGTTSDPTPSLTGTAEAGILVTLYDGSTLLGTTTANVTTGAWSFTPSAALTEGGHSLVAFATDTAGNESGDFAVLQLTVDTTPPDTTAPVAPVITTASGTVGTATPTLAGTAEAGCTVTLFESSTLLGSAIANAGGAWSFTPSVPLANGPHYFIATATDAAGNVSFPAICVLQIQAVSATYATWAAAHFSAADLLDPAISGTTADPDGSGLTNLLRYAFDLPARGPVAAPTTVVYDSSGNPATLTLSFPVRADGTDLVYAVMASEDLETWTQKAAYTPYGSKETVYCAVAVPTDAKRYFLRVEILTNR